MAKGKIGSKGGKAPAAKGGAKPAAKGPVAFKDWAYTPKPGMQDSQGAVQDFQARKMAYDKYARGFQAAPAAKAAAPVAKAKAAAPAKVAKPMPAAKPVGAAAGAAPIAAAPAAAAAPAGPQPTVIKNKGGNLRANPLRDTNSRFNALTGGIATSPFWKP